MSNSINYNYKDIFNVDFKKIGTTNMMIPIRSNIMTDAFNKEIRDFLVKNIVSSWKNENLEELDAIYNFYKGITKDSERFIMRPKPSNLIVLRVSKNFLEVNCSSVASVYNMELLDLFLDKSSVLLDMLFISLSGEEFPKEVCNLEDKKKMLMLLLGDYKKREHYSVVQNLISFIFNKSDNLNLKIGIKLEAEQKIKNSIIKLIHTYIKTKDSSTL